MAYLTAKPPVRVDIQMGLFAAAAVVIEAL